MGNHATIPARAAKHRQAGIAAARKSWEIMLQFRPGQQSIDKPELQRRENHGKSCYNSGPGSKASTSRNCSDEKIMGNHAIISLEDLPEE
jgi:hypothetical protein